MDSRLEFEIHESQDTIRLLQEELAETNREVLALTLELESRVEQRTAELTAAQNELRRSNAELVALANGLEARVRERTSALENANHILQLEIAERERTELELETQVKRMDLLHRITRAIRQRQDLASIFQVVLRTLESDLPLDYGCVCSYDAGANEILVTHVGGALALRPELERIDSASFPANEDPFEVCLRGELAYNPDIGKLGTTFAQYLVTSGIQSLVAAPLLAEGEVSGILVAARCARDAFGPGDCDFLRALSEHVGLAAHQAQLHETLRQAYEHLRRTQQMVMQQDRLRALGQMASGIAHDINNAISPVALYTESLLDREEGLSDRARGYLQTIQRAVNDVARTVSRMREFYRPRETEATFTPVLLNPLVEQVAELTRVRWKDMPHERGITIQLETELSSELPLVLGAENEIRDALTNVIFNAVDAMSCGGTLKIRTCTDSSASGMQVKLEVSDTGVGMDEETRRRCLEPFFTTKGERGTGLGLPMVYGMAQRHHADLAIESEPGKGTTVRLCFPVQSTLPPHANTLSRYASQNGSSKALRILVIDDDPLLIRSLRDALVGEGHIVTTANSGQQGIDLCVEANRRGSPFAVVITDLGMPDTDGRKVAAGIKGLCPLTPIILLTGWGHQLRENRKLPQNVDYVLSKPPKMQELRSILHRSQEGFRATNLEGNSGLRDTDILDP